MLNKKAIAAFAAAATLVSGLALAVPALASGPAAGSTPSTQTGSDVKELAKVSFKFVNGSKSVTTRAVKVYTKDGKYGFSEDAITSSAAQLTEAFLADVKDNDAVKNVKGVSYPTVITAGVNTVNVSDHAASNKEQTPEALAHQAEQEAAVALAKVSFKFVNGSKSVTTRAVKVYTKDGKYGFSEDAITSSAAQLTEAFLADVKDNDAVKNVKGVSYPTVITAGVNTVNVSDHAASNKEQTPEALAHQAEQEAKNPDATKIAIADIAIKAKDEGLGRKVVTSILKAKTVEEARTLLADAEKNVGPVKPKPPVTPVTPVNPTPVVPPAPKPVNPVTPKPVNPDHTTPSEPSTPSTPSDETPSSDDTTPSSSSTPSVTTPSASTPAGASQSAPAAVAAGVPAAPASVADLLPGLKGMITVGANNVVVAGAVNRVALNISNQAFLDRLNRDGSAKAYAFIYSSPRLLKGADGANYVTVRMVNGKPQFDAMFPAGYSGKHTVVLVDEQGNQLGWTDITMKSGVSNGLPNSGVGVALTALAASVLAGAGAAFRKIRR